MYRKIHRRKPTWNTAGGLNALELCEPSFFLGEGVKRHARCTIESLSVWVNMVFPAIPLAQRGTAWDTNERPGMLPFQPVICRVGPRDHT